MIEGKENYIFQLTTGKNENYSILGKYDNKYNLSMINLNECETLLKNTSQISPELSLIFLKFEKISEIAAEKNIQYEIYEPINKTRVNLSICKSVSIDIFLPISINEKSQEYHNELKEYGYDLFNIKDSFYNDIWTKYKSDRGTDITLTDRKNYYYTKETTCQDNCQYSEYSIESQLLKCECNISNEQIYTINMEKLNGLALFQSFYKVLKYSNYKVIKCYNLIFKKNEFSKNYGSITVIVYFGIYLIFLIIFAIRGISPLKTSLIYTKFEKGINDKKIIKRKITINSEYNALYISNNNKKNYIKKRNKKTKPFITENNSRSFIVNKTTKIKNHIRNNKRSKTTKTEVNNNKKYKKSITQINESNPIKRNHTKRQTPSIKKSNFNINEGNENNFIKKNHRTVRFNLNKDKDNLNISNGLSKIKCIRLNTNVNSSLKIFPNKKDDVHIFKSKSSKKKIKLKKKEEQLDDLELNDLEYLEAIDLDKRPFSQIYWFFLKRNHLILFTFFSWNDYNLYYIKFARFLFLICTDMAMNVFFFSDNSMHKIYLNYGKYKFIQQIPQILYSSLLSLIIELFLCYLSFTDKSIYRIKKLLKRKKNKDDVFHILKCVKIKLICFFIFISVFFALYWYIISCFCAVYENTQIIFIKDSIFRFFTGLIYPFVIYLFPAVLRILSLKDKQKKSKCMYRLSDIIPIF